MVNIEKYRNDGWGLSKKCLKEISEILDKIKNPVVVEFGSGISTKFFIDYIGDNGEIISFDHDPKYAAKISKIKRLVECVDDDFNFMFENLIYDFSKMKYRTDPPHTRQKNCFYDIKSNDIPNKIDLVVVDGSHGNGRSFAFLHVKNKMKKGGYIVVDDYNHYDFSEKLLKVFPNAKIVSEMTTGTKNQWELGGNYRIFKV